MRALAGAAALSFPLLGMGQTPPGTVIRDIARVDFVRPGNIPAFQYSNEVSVIVQPARSRSSLTVLRAPVFTTGASAPPNPVTTTSGPTQCLGSAGVGTLPNPTLANGTSIDPLQPATLATTATVHGGEAVFVRVLDADQNRDAAALDTIELEVRAATGDVERLRLVETGVSTGEFVGYIQTRTGAVSAGDCMLQVERNGSLQTRYVDAGDGTDTAGADVLVDPFGLVFDSRSGAAVNGARVRLLTAEGSPAQVYGDDGVSRYPDEVTTGETVTDSGGTVYALAAGEYRFPLVASGGYRLEIVPPAQYHFPSSVAEAQLQTLPGAPFDIGPGSYGNAFDAPGPTPAIVDVPLDPSSTALYVQKTSTAKIAAAGDFVQYSVSVQNTDTAGEFTGVTLVDRLPPGLRYQAGSARLGNARLADPAVSADGSTLQFDIGELAAGDTATLRYVVEVTIGARGPQLVNRAQAVAGNGVRSNEAQASIELREELFRERAILMGRIVDGGCERDASVYPGVPNVRVYLEDGRYAVTDDEGKYHFEGVLPGTHVVQLDTLTLPEGYEATLCADRVRHAGRSYSQFVDVRGGALWRADFVVARTGLTASAVNAPVTPATAAPAPASPAASASDAAAKRAALNGTPSFSLETLKPGIAWLWPQEDFSPPIPSLKIAIEHGPKDKAELTLNGQPVSALNFDGAVSNRAKTLAVSHWRGVDLTDGDNLFVAIVKGPDGAEIQRLERRVHYGSGAVRAEIDRAQSRLVADGRSRPVVAVRMVDRDGKPARRGTVGAWSVDAPYRTWWEVESLRENQLLAVGNREPTFQVDDDGLARLELEPTSQTGTALIRLRMSDRQTQELRVWLEPEAREWILVGLAEGSAAYNSISQNAEAAAAADIEENYSQEGRVAFFAKGRIRGDFLLTLAYDSARDPELARRRLLGVIEPDRYYTLYGDASDPRHDAASTEKLYVKLERRQFMALFGDYETGLTITELTRYSRSLTGFRTDYAGDRFGVMAFAADSAFGFQKDELRGDGTSGLYRLSRGNIVVNSDKIRLEVRDRFRTEVVLESRPLQRFLDYSIDYLAGTLFFKQPVPSRDENFNPIYIIAEYELISGGKEQLTAGGRVSAKLAGDRGEIGASYIDEQATAGDSRVGGADFRWRFGAETELRAEVARSESDDPERSASADAYLTELRHISEKVDARLYVGETESGFGTGQQLSSEVGMRKAGVDARVDFARNWQTIGEAYMEKVLDTGAERQYASLQVRRETDRNMVGVGARHVADSGLEDRTLRSEQAFVEGSIDLGDRWKLRASVDAALGGRDESSDYPNRYLAGVDYELRRDVTIFTEYEHAEGAQIRTDMTRVGVRATPWERAQINTSVNQQSSEYGPRTFANFGLTQGWQVTDRLALDFGIDQSRTIAGEGLRPLVPDRPLASGSLTDDFFATFVGALWRTELWTATSRLEFRNADTEDRWLLNGGLYREPVRGHAFALGLDVLSSAATDGPDSSAAGLQFAWALRPSESRWILLDRLDLRYEAQREPGSDVDAARIINNLNASWQLDARTQLGAQWGLRYVRSNFDGERYDGLSDLYGVDFRRDLTRRFDIGLHATLMNSWQSGVSDRSLGFDVGVTVARNVWISIGYNLEGFDDDDYAASRYTSQGPFVKLRIKADQDTFRDLSMGILRKRPSADSPH